MKTTPPSHSPDAPARVLALMVAANGCVDARELQALEDLGAFGHLGMPRERFAALAQECLRELGNGFEECSWLTSRELTYVDHLLDAVPDAQERLLICRLAAAVVTADGRVSGGERRLYDHVLARWHISQGMVTDAILQHVERRSGA